MKFSFRSDNFTSNFIYFHFTAMAKENRFVKELDLSKISSAKGWTWSAKIVNLQCKIGLQIVSFDHEMLEI